MENIVRHLSKKALENEQKVIQEQVSHWEHRLKEAQKELEYWIRQQEALSTVFARYLFVDEE